MGRGQIKYYWGDRNLTIRLGNRTNLRIMALFLLEFLITGAVATFFLLQPVPLKTNFFHFFAGKGAALLYLLAAYRFLARMFFRESIMLDNYAITLVSTTIFYKQVRRYYWFNIGELHYEGKVRKTDHPLKGKCFDYFGFETQEQLIQNLHHPGNMYIETGEGRVYFAFGVYSWDAEEMVQLMKIYVGNALKLGPEWAEMLQFQESDDYNA